MCWCHSLVLGFHMWRLMTTAHDLYRWVLLKADFLGAWKSVWLKHYLAYPIIIISFIIQRNLAKKIRAKWESGLTAVWLKRDPPVLTVLLYLTNQGNLYMYLFVFMHDRTPRTILLSLSCLNILADKIILLKQSSQGNLHLGYYLTRERPLDTCLASPPGIHLPLALNKTYPLLQE